MNFLGHFLLAGTDEGLLVGNFVADFVKGKSYQDFPDHIARGILMHREIDFFTDNHFHFKQSKRRLHEKHRHFTGVIVDIFYDHFLAADFERFSGQKLAVFAENIYKIIEKYREVLPDRSKFVFGYMKRDNWLLRYSKLEGIESTLRGMSKRIKHENYLDRSLSDLEFHYEAMRHDFDGFIKDAFRNFENWAPGRV